jgi:single-stranded-DNA-specific exonuclease
MAAPKLPETASSLFSGRSATGRHWRLSAADESLVRRLQREAGVNDLLARLLALRGVEPGTCAEFLSPTLRALFPDPATFAGMNEATELVLDAILHRRRVTVFADYDVDGGTSSAILARYFRAWGLELGLYVPDRLEEGYGPSPDAFRRIQDGGAELVITVDCGAAAVDALDEARRIGLPVVVIDHHLMGASIPETAALVNPNRPDCASGQGHLAAAGVVFVFVAALNRLARERGVAPPAGLPDLLNWLDLCALGTLCDMAPLKGVNRAFVRQGLAMLSRGLNPGLLALTRVAGLGQSDSVYHATFMLGPRLNAGGRIGDPWLAARLLATDDPAEAMALAEQLHALNEARKAVETAILDAAVQQAEKALRADPARNILIASGEGWHPGVIGIVAGRLRERFHKPAIVIGWGKGLGPVAKGSGRSVPGINLGEAISQAAREGRVLSGGGHAMAAGLSLHPEQIGAFDDWMRERLSGFGEACEAARDLEIDGLLAPGAASPELTDEIAALGPFGAGMPEPVFAMPGVYLSGVRAVGTGHLRFQAADSAGSTACIAWRAGAGPLADVLREGRCVHLAGRLKADQWNGRRRVQFEVSDALPA